MNVILINHYIVLTNRRTIYYISNSWIHFFTIDYRSWWRNIIVGGIFPLHQYMLHMLSDHYLSGYILDLFFMLCVLKLID